MIAEPTDTPVTAPNEFTVATLVFEEDHITALFVALDGKIDIVNDFVEPVCRVNDAGERLIDVAGTIMVNVHFAVSLPLRVVAVIIALPAETAVTTPDEFTAAFAELELHITVLSVALEGATVAVSMRVLVG